MQDYGAVFLDKKVADLAGRCQHEWLVYGSSRDFWGRFCGLRVDLGKYLLPSYLDALWILLGQWCLIPYPIHIKHPSETMVEDGGSRDETTYLGPWNGDV